MNDLTMAAIDGGPVAVEVLNATQGQLPIYMIFALFMVKLAFDFVKDRRKAGESSEEAHRSREVELLESVVENTSGTRESIRGMEEYMKATAASTDKLHDRVVVALEKLSAIEARQTQVRERA